MYVLIRNCMRQCMCTIMSLFVYVAAFAEGFQHASRRKANNLGVLLIKLLMRARHINASRTHASRTHASRTLASRTLASRTHASRTLHFGGSPGRGSPGRGSPGRGSPGRGSPGRGNVACAKTMDIVSELYSFWGERHEHQSEEIERSSSNTFSYYYCRRSRRSPQKR